MPDDKGGFERMMRERCAAASKAPWKRRYNHRAIYSGTSHPWPTVISADSKVPGEWIPGRSFTIREDADLEFIAHARTDIPYLLDAVDELKAKLVKAREGLKWYAKMERWTAGSRHVARKALEETGDGE